ncbi:hypothetical protein LCGC14_1685760 [marine sediment metagenome]|uniref:Uncharacterized protein n=1 Tax=marine sediment metagenome TaxID=412755 RepID=A0A0F9K2U8_9ZZZZ
MLRPEGRLRHAGGPPARLLPPVMRYRYPAGSRPGHYVTGARLMLGESPFRDGHALIGLRNLVSLRASDGFSGYFRRPPRATLRSSASPSGRSP